MSETLSEIQQGNPLMPASHFPKAHQTERPALLLVNHNEIQGKESFGN
jgi:hypothetical protein